LRAVAVGGGGTLAAAAAAAAACACAAADAGAGEEPARRPPTDVEATGPAAPLARRPGPAARPGERVYTRAEVAANDGADGRPMWLTYRDGVYDVTAFQREHPGGHLITQAAGADVSAFWDIWAYHHQAPKVGQYLESLRVGTLRAEDVVGGTEAGSADDPYQSEPVRAGQSVQTVLSVRPYCSETPNKALGASYLTSAAALYVRNHAPVPDVAWPPQGESRAAHTLRHEVVFEPLGNGGGGGGGDDDDDEAPAFTVAQLQARFGTTTVTSILQCAGNRASEDIAATGASGFAGTPFEDITQGMLGNAQWTGVRLADVLPALYPEACAAARRHGGGEWHVVFEGADGYSASTPLARVMARQNDCLLATHMNGEPLSPDHGYPVRALLPGVAGARNVKWLQSVSLQRSAVDAPWNAYYYKNAKAEEIQGLPLQSLILDADAAVAGPAGTAAAAAAAATTTTTTATTLRLSGVAYSGGSGNAIARVEVSADGGETWSDADINTDEIKADGSQGSFGWVRWSAELEVGAEVGSVCCRATDVEGKTQQEVPAKERGYIFNGWSKVDVGHATP
jgi:sulfite oxidase